jgi:hypothetical protein
MKKLALFLVFFATVLFAQAQYPWKDQMDHTFQHMDKSGITTGLLEDYSMPLADITRYQGNSALTDDGLVTLEVWRKIYGTLTTADINGTQPLPLLSGINTNIEQASAGNVIPLALMWVNYQKLQEDALSSGQMRVENTDQLHNNTGSTPLNQRMAVAATPAENVAWFGAVDFLYDASLFITHGQNGQPYAHLVRNLRY